MTQSVRWSIHLKAGVLDAKGELIKTAASVMLQLKKGRRWHSLQWHEVDLGRGQSSEQWLSTEIFCSAPTN